MIGPRATHGIRATYARGCRCDLCREAWRVTRLPKNRERRARLRGPDWVDGRTLRTSLTPEHRAKIAATMRKRARQQKERKAVGGGSG